MMMIGAVMLLKALCDHGLLFEYVHYTNKPLLNVVFFPDDNLSHSKTDLSVPLILNASD